MDSMQSIFLNAKQKLCLDLQSPEVAHRLDTVDVVIVEPEMMARNLNGDHYRRYLNVPAYYDPNSHRVYLNRRSLSKSSEKTAFIICYHELVHGASHHAKYDDNEHTQIFQSGIKIEAYKRNQYHCANKLFNEGIVQYFTTKNNGVPAQSYAYSKEVELISMIAADLGDTVLKEALLSGTFSLLTVRFEEYYGFGSFNKFTRLLDRKHYEKAKAVLSQNVQPIAFSWRKQPVLVEGEITV